MNSTISPKDVEHFLRENPDFFEDRPALLAALNMSNVGEGTMSLFEEQLAILRERTVITNQKAKNLNIVCGITCIILYLTNAVSL